MKCHIASSAIRVLVCAGLTMQCCVLPATRASPLPPPLPEQLEQPLASSAASQSAPRQSVNNQMVRHSLHTSSADFMEAPEALEESPLEDVAKALEKKPEAEGERSFPILKAVNDPVVDESRTEAVQDHNSANEGEPGRQMQGLSIHHRVSKEIYLKSQVNSKEKQDEHDDDDDDDDKEEGITERKIRLADLENQQIQDENEAEKFRKFTHFRTDNDRKDHDSDNTIEEDDVSEDVAMWMDAPNDEYPAESPHLEPSAHRSEQSGVAVEERLQASRGYGFADVMRAWVEAGGGEEAKGYEEMKRGEEEVDNERLGHVRVIVLNETLYLNSTTDDVLMPQFQPVPMPVNFEDYDVNKDGMISLPELRYVSRASEGAKQAFGDADSNGDGWVDRGEFLRTGWGRKEDNGTPPSHQLHSSAASPP